jgi:hypothetical protein
MRNEGRQPFAGVWGVGNSDTSVPTFPFLSSPPQAAHLAKSAYFLTDLARETTI